MGGAGSGRGRGYIHIYLLCVHVCLCTACLVKLKATWPGLLYGVLQTCVYMLCPLPYSIGIQRSTYAKQLKLHNNVM